MSAERQVPAIVLAGGSGAEAVAQAWSLPHKALVPVAGTPAVQHVAAALRGAERVSEVVVVTQTEAVGEACPEGVACLAPAGPHFLDTVQAGLAHFPEADRVLLATSDLALLTPAAVDDFLAQALDSGADVCYSMVERAQLEGLPGSDSRTYVHLREGSYSGGNLALVSRRFVEEHGARLRQAFAGRKSPVALASMFGVVFIWRLWRGKLGVPDLIKRGEEILRVPLWVVDSRYVEVCFDLDAPEQVAQSEQILALRQAP